ncbi:uncharacterized protein BDW47DRAFT_104625 [Aspergillus candidus]|uniref:Uncharacterized protein n=1 Tax=Aspergillus candidus TaxID=41067 RepID=A0A2I2FDG3_ASPCN|nr:hypothetical protein BDW47DRAFT_104625 [Aspergillus candidus]PLB38649.1 hypothetical protein BDW47DRAFT_104625 [Aspergillus candidus]
MHAKYILALIGAAAAGPLEGLRGGLERRGVSPIPPLQIAKGEKFIGAPTVAKPLDARVAFSPNAMNMHQDGGNTGTIDLPGPLGKDLKLTTAVGGLHILLWTRKGQMVVGYTTLSLSGLKWGIAAVGEDMSVQAEWYPEVDGQTLNVAYMELMLETNELVVTSKEGQIYIIKVKEDDEKPSLELQQMINLTSTLGKGEMLMNAMYDSEQNLWFSSGGLRENGGHGDSAQNSSTIGYLEKGGMGVIHELHIEDQMIENGIAVDGTTAYVITGPSGKQDKAGAKGYFIAFGPGKDKSLTTHWNVTYDAGDKKKPGSFSRGSGATPALMGDQYVAMTDAKEGQSQLVIYHQKAQKDAESQVVCSVPVFPETGSKIDIAPLVHKQGDTYSVYLCNGYNAPPLFYADTGTLNGKWNNLTQMTPGVARIDVSSEGKCNIAWEKDDLRIQSVPIISTKNGLVYGYTQAEEFTEDGLYVWYIVALDYRTGEEVWRIRAGAGGTFNDDFQPGALGPDGSFYQSVIGGLIRLQDGA